RRTSVRHQVPCITTLEGGMAAVSGIEALQKQKVEIHCLQDLYPRPPVHKPAAPATAPKEAATRLASPPKAHK
ncbi:MAG: hypothetical protein ACRD4T_14995, partial [Candidatus Acidiferrales bacterium]